MAEEKPKGVFIEPSAAGPTQKVSRDGVVSPGKLGQAQDGAVTNPGVRKLGSAMTDPRCPSCGNSTLKMRMNKKAGQRIYCSNPDCDYDQSKQSGSSIRVNSDTTIVTARSGPSGDSGGVKIIRQSRGG